jgi:deoxyribodipyrimidine photo-lyase
MKDKISIFWFRRDLRLDDNTALYYALNSGNKVLPIFIFDEEIIASLPKNDARVSFIYETLFAIQQTIKNVGGSILIKKGEPLKIWEELYNEYKIDTVHLNKDYEPYAIKRDQEIIYFLKSKNIKILSYKDQVIFEENEVLKNDNKPYTVYTPYKNKWLKNFNRKLHTRLFDSTNYMDNFVKTSIKFPSITSLGFEKSEIKVNPFNLNNLANYEEVRDYPALNRTSKLSPYLRFGLVSIRKVVQFALITNSTFLSELIWREFFMQVLFHFPKVVTQNFRPKYDVIPWRNNEEEFKKWSRGETGYPLVDAGIRELNKTGYMHNRVRMVVAGFLCKHLLIDWRWGEAYFAEKLLDYDLAANNGNWQWASGTGCDAAPYFRVFNPTEQLKKFDKDLHYVKKWVQDFDELTYPMPIVEHKFARERAIKTYKDSLKQ